LFKITNEAMVNLSQTGGGTPTLQVAGHDSCRHLIIQNQTISSVGSFLFFGCTLSLNIIPYNLCCNSFLNSVYWKRSCWSNNKNWRL